MRTARYRRIVLAATLGIVTTVTASVGFAAPDGASGSQQTCPIPLLGADPDTVTLSGPATLWPPNHRAVDYTLTASETPGEKGDGLPHGVTISYSITASDGAAGSSPPSGAAKGDFSVPVHFQLTADRSGNGSTRTYTIAWTASFDDGPHACSSSASGEHPFVVTVPHDNRHHG